MSAPTGATYTRLDCFLTSSSPRSYGANTARKTLSNAAEIWGIPASQRTYYDASPGASNIARTSLSLWSEGLRLPPFHSRGPHALCLPFVSNFKHQSCPIRLSSFLRKGRVDVSCTRIAVGPRLQCRDPYQLNAPHVATYRCWRCIYSKC